MTEIDDPYAEPARCTPLSIPGTRIRTAREPPAELCIQPRKRQRRQYAPFEEVDGPHTGTTAQNVVEPCPPPPSERQSTLRSTHDTRNERAEGEPPQPGQAEEHIEDDDEPERKETVFVAMHAFDFKAYRDLQEPDPANPRWCARCHFSIPRNQMNRPNKWVAIMNYIKENRFKVKPAEFVRTVQTMYIEDVQKKLVDMNNKTYTGPPWMAYEIWNHDNEHVRSSQGVMQEVLETHLWTFRNIRDHQTVSDTRYVDKEGNETFRRDTNVGKANLLLKIGVQIAALATKLAPHENHYMS